MTFITTSYGVIDTSNSSALALAIAGSFVGTYVSSFNFTGVTITIFLAPVQFVSLLIDESPDGGVTFRTTTIVTVQQSETHTITISTQNMRIRVLANQGTAATGYVQTVFHRSSCNTQVKQLGSQMRATDDSLTVHSLIAANASGTYTDLTIASAGGLLVTATNPDNSLDTTMLYDAFGRARVSGAQPNLTSKLISNVANVRDYDDVQASGAGTSSTYSENRASVTLGVSNLTAGTRVRQSIQRADYIPGTSLLLLFSMVPGPCGVGITKRWGYFDANNGTFWQAKSVAGVDHLQIVLRSFVTGVAVDTVIDQSAFNGVAIPVGFSITKAGLYGFDYQWLGVGRIRCFIELAGKIYVINTIDNVGATSVYMSKPNLPIRYELINDGTGALSTMEVICSSQIIEDSTSVPRRFSRSANMGTTGISLSADGFDHALIALRINPSNLSAVIQFFNFTLVVLTTNAQFLWKLVYRATVAGAAFVWNTPNVSGAQYAIADVTNTVTGGELIASGYADATNQSATQNISELPSWYLGSTVAGVPYEFLLTVQKLDGTSDTFIASMNWIEYI